MSLPKKVLSRKDEITADFLRLFDEHMDDLGNERFHTSYVGRLFIHPTHPTNTIKLTTGKLPCETWRSSL